jgi:hypothetical protein
MEPVSSKDEAAVDRQLRGDAGRIATRWDVGRDHPVAAADPGSRWAGRPRARGQSWGVTRRFVIASLGAAWLERLSSQATTEMGEWRRRNAFGSATHRHVGDRHPEERISPRRRPRPGRSIVTPCIGAVRRIAGGFRLSPRQGGNTIATGFGPDRGPASRPDPPASCKSIGRRASRYGRRPIASQRPRLDAGSAASIRQAARLADAGRGKSPHRAQAGRLGLLLSIHSWRDPGSPPASGYHHADSQARSTAANYHESLGPIAPWPARSSACSPVGSADPSPRR